MLFRSRIKQQGGLECCVYAQSFFFPFSFHRLSPPTPLQPRSISFSPPALPSPTRFSECHRDRLPEHAADLVPLNLPQPPSSHLLSSLYPPVERLRQRIPMMPSPCLTIRVPGSSSSSSTHSTQCTPAFGISTYSHRTTHRARSTTASRFRDMFAAPEAEVTPSSPVFDVSLGSRRTLSDGEVGKASAWEDDASGVEQVATPRTAGPSSASHQSSKPSGGSIPFPIVLGVKPPSPDQNRPLRRSDSPRCSSHSSYHSGSQSTSELATFPNGTLVSISNAKYFEHRTFPPTSPRADTRTPVRREEPSADLVSVGSSG